MIFYIVLNLNEILLNKTFLRSNCDTKYQKMQFCVQCCMQEMSQLTYSYISMILDLYARDVANDLSENKLAL